MNTRPSCLTKERVEQLMRDAGKCINIVNGNCAILEDTLCAVTSLCCQLLDQMEKVPDLILSSWEDWSAHAGQAAQQEQDADVYTEEMRARIRTALMEWPK